MKQYLIIAKSKRAIVGDNNIVVVGIGLGYRQEDAIIDFLKKYSYATAGWEVIFVSNTSDLDTCTLISVCADNRYGININEFRNQLEDIRCDS